MDSVGVEGGAEANGLGKFCCPVDGDTVQRFRPPVVGGDIEAGNGAGLIDELGGFLVEGHLLDESGGALLRRQSGVEPDGLWGVLPGWLLCGRKACGAEDCGVVSPNAVKAVVGGYSLRGDVTYGVGVTGNEADGPTRQENINETVPYSQSLPSPDGAYWRCKRPDGSPRCFFAPKPGS